MYRLFLYLQIQTWMLRIPYSETTLCPFVLFWNRCCNRLVNKRKDVYGMGWDGGGDQSGVIKGIDWQRLPDWQLRVWNLWQIPQRPPRDILLFMLADALKHYKLWDVGSIKMYIIFYKYWKLYPQHVCTKHSLILLSTFCRFGIVRYSKDHG